MCTPARSILCVFVSALACTQKQTPAPTCTLGERIEARCTTVGDLRVATLEASVARDGEPLVFIPGGPGQRPFDTLAEVASAFEDVRKHHDIVAIERPEPTCSVSADSLVETARACAKEMPAVLPSTEQYVADIVRVMPQRFAVYGTRVALELMRAHPERLTAVILDGVIAPESTIRSAKASSPLEGLPRDVEVRHPRTGVMQHVKLTQRRVDETLRQASYSSELAALLPRMIAEKDYAALAALSLQQEATLERTINPFVYYSVFCREDVPTDEDLEHICAFWPVQKAPPRTAITSNVRTLLISGENDPVTPPSEAEKVVRTLSRATSLVLRDQGHVNLYRGCVPRLMSDFLKSDAPLDTRCIERATALPVLNGMNGP